MTWLYSLYWLGAFAIAGPIFFHLRRTVPRGQQLFSTLMFLTPSPPKVTRRSRIEDWLLLIIRSLAILLLAFAFTRPLWRIPAANPEALVKEHLLAIVVDTSASMRREGLWEKAIQQLDQRIAELPDETTVGVFQFDHSFVPLVDFDETSKIEPAARRNLIRQRLKQVQPTWAGTQLGEAMVRAATILQDLQTERSKPVPRTIWLMSDLQSGSETISLKGYEWPRDLVVELIRAQPVSASNAGIQWVEANPDLADDTPRVRLTNSADSVLEQFSIRWDQDPSAELKLYVPPGQSRIIRPPAYPDGTASSSLVLTGDNEPFDNRLYASVINPEVRTVLYCGTDAAEDSEGQRFYLERVLTGITRFQVDLKSWRDVEIDSINARRTLLVLTEPEDGIATFISQYLQRGGALLISAATADTLKACLTLCGQNQWTVSESTVARYAMLEQIRFDHPLFAPFAESQFSDFTGIRIWKHRSIGGLTESSITGQSVDSATSAHVMARFDNGDPAIFDFAQGRIVVFATGWQPADSQFARSSKFPMLLTRLLELATDLQQRQEYFTVGDSIPWPASLIGAGVSTGSVVLPDGTKTDPLEIDKPFDKSRQPGIYQLNAGSQSGLVAVNLSPEESRTTPLTVDQLEALGLKFKRPATLENPLVQKERQRHLQLAELEQTQKFWRTLLIVCFGLLLLETFVSGLLSLKSNRSLPA